MPRPSIILLLLGLARHSVVSAQGVIERLTLSELRRAPLTITIDARPLIVKPYAYLNLMPAVVLPGDEQDKWPIPFHLVLRICTSDSQPLPQGFDANFAWISAGGHFWGDTLRAPQPDTDPRFLFRTLGGGPGWLMKSDSIDVVVRFVRPGHHYQLLRMARLPVDTAS
jgi:hypothetical protein